MNVKVGKIYKVKKGCEGECGAYINFGGSFIKITSINDDGYLYYDILDEKKSKISKCRCFEPKHLEPLAKTLESLEEGNIVVDEYGDQRKVLGVCGMVYLMSEDDDFDTFDGGYTAKDLEEEGYKPLQEESEELDEEAQKAIKLLEEKGFIKDGKVVQV